MSRSGLTIAVIGGGASGMIAAGAACSYGADVTIFEHSNRLGKKLAITGKGRCNVTNNCDEKEFLANVTRNPRFLFSAIYAFPPAKTIELFNELGVELKTERGNRVFPVSDKAKDIVDALVKYCRDCEKIYENVIAVKKASDSFLIETNKGTYQFDRVIISTGGKSYPLTGSDGSGYKIALKLGHTISAITPSLIPIESSSPLCAEMMGLSLKNVSIRIVNENGKTLYSDFGEMLFTHFGVSGPIVLSASAHIKDLDVSSLSMIIDLKPALDEKTLDTRLLSDFLVNSNKNFSNVLSALLPSKMIDPFIKYCKLDPTKKVNTITKEERKIILNALKGFSIPLSGLRPISEAIITSGGINVKEIMPKTMESKLVPGLYFAGEIIDVDAYTGGFNLQIAFSTGFLAGKNAAETLN